jgi:HK97 family phage major capsid protein
MDALVEKRAELEAKRQALHAIFAEAGADFDLMKSTALEGDSKHRAEQVRALNDELTALGKEVETLQGVRDAAANVKSIGDKLDTPASQMQHPAAGGGDGTQGPLKSIGELFVESDAYKGFKRGSGIGPVAELKAWRTAEEFKTVMSQGTGFAPETIRTGRLVEAALAPIQVIDLIPPGVTDQAAVVYMLETVATSGAAEVAESAQGALVTWAESALQFAQQTSTVRKISTWLPVTDEQLEDVAFIQSFVNMRLSLFIRQRLDSQILVGNGVAPNLLGFLNVPTIQTQAKGADPTPDAIYKAMTLVRVTGRAIPSGVVLHPNDWQAIRLLRTADGIYIWGSPSEAAPERIWGLPVAQADVITENTGLVGDFRGYCQLVMRRGIEVQISNSHASYFIQGVQAIRADMRAAFPVYRPTAFCLCTGI